MGLESLGKKLAQLGQDTVNSMQKTAEGVQLNSKIADEKKALEKLFAQIGESVFEKAGDVIPEGLEDVFAAVKSAKESLADLEVQKQKLTRTKPVCPSCGKEVAKGENYCSACGTELSSVWQEEEGTAEEGDAPADDVLDAEALKADARAAANEVGDLVNEAADKARGILGGFAEAADAFFKGVASKVNEKKEEAEEAFDDTAEELQDVFEDAQEEAEEAAEEVKEAAEEACCEAKETAEEACCEAKETVEEACCEAKETVEEACCEAKENVEAAAEAVCDAAEEKTEG